MTAGPRGPTAGPDLAGPPAPDPRAELRAALIRAIELFDAPRFVSIGGIENTCSFQVDRDQWEQWTAAARTVLEYIAHDPAGAAVPAPPAGLTVETLAALADQYLDEHVPHTTVPTTRPGLVHDFATWLAPRLPVSPGAPAAARRATPKIYLASRSRHGARWRALRESGVPIISTWIDENEPGQTTDYGDLMRRCIEEASRATAFICYAEGDDIAGWKGVWFEMGAACAAGVPVFFVGTHDFPSALRHPNVTFCADLDEALRAALAARENTL